MEHVIRWALLFGFAVALKPLNAVAQDQGATTIHASYTIWNHRLTPPGKEWAGKTLNDITLVFSGHTIREVFKEKGSTTQRNNDHEWSLGQNHWHIVGPHSMQMVDKYPQNIVTITINVFGSRCKVLWQSQLLPGFADHMLPSMSQHNLQHYTDAHMVDSVCTIKKTE